jgi:hypothetical protein
MEVLKKRNKDSKKEKERAATIAGKWRRELDKLEGWKFCEVWNRMVAEAVAQEVDDHRYCEVLTFPDESVLLNCDETGIREVLLPQEAVPQRIVYYWRLVGTRRVSTEQALDLPQHFLKAKNAAKRPGICVAELCSLVRGGKLLKPFNADVSSGFFAVNDLDLYRRRNPLRRKGLPPCGVGNLPDGRENAVSGSSMQAVHRADAPPSIERLSSLVSVI